MRCERLNFRLNSAVSGREGVYCIPDQEGGGSGGGRTSDGNLQVGCNVWYNVYCPAYSVHTGHISIGGQDGQIEGKIEGISGQNRGQKEGISKQNGGQNQPKNKNTLFQPAIFVMAFMFDYATQPYL